MKASAAKMTMSRGTKHDVKYNDLGGRAGHEGVAQCCCPWEDTFVLVTEADALSLAEETKKPIESV